MRCVWSSLLTLLLAYFLQEASSDITFVAPLGMFPHQAALFSMKRNILTGNITYVFECSATLIHKEFVISTASCIDTANITGPIAVGAGFVDRIDGPITYNNASSIIRHNLYVEGERQYDIALIKFSPSFPESSSIAIAKLRDTAAVIGADCTISGWRKDLITLSPVLRYNNISLLNTSECHELITGEICAGEPAMDDRLGCQLGDEGSPVSCGGLLTGVLHYNANTCFSEPEPGVFSDIVYHKVWINSVLTSGGATLDTTATTTGYTTGELGGGAGSITWSMLTLALHWVFTIALC